MTGRAQTADQITMERQPRDRWSPTVKLSSVMAFMLMSVTLGGLVWTMAVLVTSKADKSTVHRIQTDVEVIKTRQQIFINTIRPGLLDKKE